MNHFPFVLDGILLLTFLVGWIESTGFTNYRWGWGRFLRALCLPLAIGVTGHLVVASRFWEGTIEANSSLLTLLFCLGMLAFFVLIVIGPIWLINLTGFVVTQFIATKGVTTVVLGDGNILFAAPIEEDETAEPEEKP